MASGGTTLSTSGGLADRYAAAIYALAGEQNALDRTVEEMAALGRLIDESESLRRLLRSPLVAVAQARAAALAVVDAQGFGKLVHDLVGVVATNRRLAALRDIVRAFAVLVAEKRGVVTAEVASAHPLSDLQRTQLLARLTEAGYGSVQIEERLDPSLLGGLVVKIGARLYDTSLKSRLQRLQYAMKGAA
ncbi:MAG TPA: F0F1 ATP synthase subunit delta [Acetobacteraceae bacterium]|nr:F0F1 ATP synthase subunit delta [Acetobacteraceae bacterium]